MPYANYWDSLSKEQAENFLWSYELGIEHPSRIEVLKWIKKNFKDSTPSLLDIPCGSGVDAHVLGEVCNYTGADNSLRMIDAFTRRFPLVSVKQADILELPFAKNEFAIVLARAIFEHLADLREVEQAMRECYRVAWKACIFSFYKPLGDEEVLMDCGTHYDNKYAKKDIEKIIKALKPKKLECKHVSAGEYTDDYDIYFLTK